MKRDHRESVVGPWAKQKLDALEAYLLAYMGVMKNQRFRLVFVDAFAGSGTSRVRGAGGPTDTNPSLLGDDETEAADEFIKGSPRRALELSRPFDEYYFFDMDQRRADLLNDLAAEYPDRTVIVQQGESNLAVQRLAKKFTDWDWRGVAFLDPYGAHLHWQTVLALADTGKFDVIINFPLGMAINRLIRRDGAVPDTWAKQLDDCFGSPEWRSLAYDSQASFFGDHSSKRHDAARLLLEFYAGRVKEAFGNLAGPSLVCNTMGAPLYHLIWAGTNPTGRPIAKHILDMGSRVAVPRK